MHDFMLGCDEHVHALSELRGEIVVEEESHAAFASDSSNSTASRTSLGWTSYHCATISWEEFAFALRANIAVGTPDFITVGWPKLRLGSMMICRFLPSGHQTTSAPVNSSSL